MILNTHQAQAVYTAMVALNNVYGKVEAIFTEKGDVTLVKETADGRVLVCAPRREMEVHANQNLFAHNYKLEV